MLGKLDKGKIPFDDYCKKIYLHNKITNILKIILLIAIWTPLIVYYFLPISKANIVYISGNPLNFSDEYIYSYTDIDPSTHIWNINPSKVEKQLLNHPYCSNAKVDLTFTGIKINIDEVRVVAKNDDMDPIYYLSNGNSVKYSSIKETIIDPLSVDYHFIKPYLDKVPLINKEEYKKDDFYIVVNDLGRIDNNLIKQIKEIKINEKTTSFTLISLIFDKDKLNIDNDLTINVDYRDIDKLLNEEIINNCVSKIKENNNQYYNVLLANDVENKEIKIVPYSN